MSEKPNTAMAVVGIDIAKNSFHVVGSMRAVHLCCVRSAHVARWKQNLPKMPAWLLGMEPASDRIISAVSGRRLATISVLLERRNRVKIKLVRSHWGNPG